MGKALYFLLQPGLPQTIPHRALIRILPHIQHHILRNAHRQHPGMLEHRREQAVKIFPWERSAVHAVHIDSARFRLQQPAQQLHQRGFPRAVHAHHRQALPGSHLKIQIPEDGHFPLLPVLHHPIGKRDIPPLKGHWPADDRMPLAGAFLLPVPLRKLQELIKIPHIMLHLPEAGNPLRQPRQPASDARNGSKIQRKVPNGHTNLQIAMDQIQIGKPIPDQNQNRRDSRAKKLPPLHLSFHQIHLRNHLPGNLPQHGSHGEYADVLCLLHPLSAVGHIVLSPIGSGFFLLEALFPHLNPNAAHKLYQKEQRQKCQDARVQRAHDGTIDRQSHPGLQQRCFFAQKLHQSHIRACDRLPGLLHGRLA